MAAAAAVEKPILIRALISSYSNDVNTLDDIGTDGYDFEKLFPRKCSSCRSNPDPGSHLADPDPVSTGSVNAWFIMESTDSGVKMSQILTGLPLDLSDLTARRTASTLVGSSLYEIGAYPNRLSYYNRESCSEMRFIDIQNQSAGWKPWSPLDFELNSIRAATFNQYIYMFSRISVDHAPDFHFACVYDTIKQEGYLIKAPPEFLETPMAEFWAPLEGQGMLVSFPRQHNGNFYLHDPDVNSWKFCDDYEPLPPMPRGPTSGPSSVLNGILYICDRKSYVLHAYDFNKGKLLYSVKLPILCINSHVYGDDRSFYPEHIVAVSDSSLYIIGSSLGCLFCARVLVTLDPLKAPSATLLGVQCFRKHRIRSVINCVPVDASLGQIAKYQMPVNASLHPMEKDPMPMVETREEHMPSNVKSTMELSEHDRKVTRFSEDASLFGRKTAELECSKKSMNPNSSLPLFPVSKRILLQPHKKKLKREQRVMAQRLSKLKLSPPPSDSTHQPADDDDGVRIVHVPAEMKLKRHQDMKDLGNSSLEGQD